MHYRINEIGDIQTEDPRHKGLTAFGLDVVKEMNKLGMVIDVAHASSDTLSAVPAPSLEHPVVYPHTGAYALRTNARHLENKDMTAIAKKGSIIGVWPLLRRRDNYQTYLPRVGLREEPGGRGVRVGIGTDLFGIASETAIPTHKEFALIPAGLLSRGYPETDVVELARRPFHARVPRSPGKPWMTIFLERLGGAHGAKQLTNGAVFLALFLLFPAAAFAASAKTSMRLLYPSFAGSWATAWIAKEAGYFSTKDWMWN